MTYTQKSGKIPLGLPTCGSHFEEIITLPKLSCGKVSHELSSTMESSRLYMWQNLVDDIQRPVVLGFAIFVPSDWLHPTTNFQSFSHTIQGVQIQMCRSVAMDPKYIYLVECTLNTLSIYFSLTFRSHATKPHKLHGCPPHHIIHTTLIEKKINHPKQDLPVFCSYDVVPCTYLLVVQWQYQ